MPCCCAINCSNRSEKGWKLFRFPMGDRRAVWANNLRRGDNWAPTKSSYLCEKHFENSQFESHRADGWRKLKPTAIPTLFDVPNPPPMINPLPRKSFYKNLSSAGNTTDSKPRHEPNPMLVQGDVLGILESQADELTRLRCENLELKKQLQEQLSTNVALAEENRKLLDQINDMDRVRRSFLNDDQIKMLDQGRMSQWPNESIMKALKFRFALSVHGYNYLRGTGYPLPSYSTIMRRIQDFKLNFGIFQDIIKLLRFKVETMDPTDRFCILSYDEMKISKQRDFDKNLGKFAGCVTLGNNLDDLGEKVYVVVARVVKTHWKQVIACHVTPTVAIDSQLLKDFMENCIISVQSCGLYVVALSSDLDSRNKSLLTSLNIQASRHGIICNGFSFNNHQIFAIPDACHILKNLKAAMLRQLIQLPQAYVDQEKLTTNIVDGSFIKKLWEYEISGGFEKRLLHHLRSEDIDPTNFEKMNVGAAVRFFSPKTSSALKTAVENGILPLEALTTAQFILTINEWFSLMSSKIRKASITSRNCDRKYIFLHTIIDLFQNAVFHEGWKPLNFGFVIATLTFCDVAEFLFKNGYDFVLGHRFTQDVTENIFSQIRRKEGSMPSALKVLQAIRHISISQFVSEVKYSSYMSDSDEYLLYFCTEKRKSAAETSSCSIYESIDTSVGNIMSSLVEFQVETFSINDFNEIVSQYEANSTFYIAGSTTNAVAKHVCSDCIEFLSLRNLPDIDFVNKAKSYTSGANLGGLKEPCLQTLSLIFHCEHFFTKYKNYILRNFNSDLIKCLVDNVDIIFPVCCNVKEKIVKHYFTVRSFCVKNFSENSKKRKNVFGTASAKRKKN